jgi:O-methyltransferase
MTDIQKFIECSPPITNMVTPAEVHGILKNLKIVLESGIEGDIVELGCNVGTTSIYIRKFLDMYNSDKKFHVYDSWEGLPQKTSHDVSLFNKSDLKVNKEQFIENFRVRDLKLPEIHSGWFKDIPDSEYPDKICFAFFDGDFYSSIMDSWDKTYDKLVPGARVVIDDCGWNNLPGVERACREFLDSKPEMLDMTGYPDRNFNYGASNRGGLVIKK